MENQTNQLRESPAFDTLGPDSNVLAANNTINSSSSSTNHNNQAGFNQLKQFDLSTDKSVRRRLDGAIGQNTEVSFARKDSSPQPEGAQKPGNGNGKKVAKTKKKTTKKGSAGATRAQSDNTRVTQSQKEIAHQQQADRQPVHQNQEKSNATANSRETAPKSAFEQDFQTTAGAYQSVPPEQRKRRLSPIKISDEYLCHADNSDFISQLEKEIAELRAKSQSASVQQQCESPLQTQSQELPEPAKQLKLFEQENSNGQNDPLSQTLTAATGLNNLLETPADSKEVVHAHSFKPQMMSKTTLNGSNDDLHKITADEVYPVEDEEDDDSLEREELEEEDEDQSNSHEQSQENVFELKIEGLFESIRNRSMRIKTNLKRQQKQQKDYSQGVLEIMGGQSGSQTGREMLKQGLIDEDDIDIDQQSMASSVNTMVNQNDTSVVTCLNAQEDEFDFDTKPDEVDLDAMSSFSMTTTAPLQDNQNASNSKTDDQPDIFQSKAVEKLIKDLKTQHAAEKELLNIDIQLYRSIIKKLSKKAKQMNILLKKQEIRMVQHKKTQNICKDQKFMIDNLQEENCRLSKQNNALKNILVEFESKRLKWVNECDFMMQELQTENQALRGLLFIGKDSNDYVEEQLLKMETELHDEKELKQNDNSEEDDQADVEERPDNEADDFEDDDEDFQDNSNTDDNNTISFNQKKVLKKLSNNNFIDEDDDDKNARSKNNNTLKEPSLSPDDCDDLDDDDEDYVPVAEDDNSDDDTGGFSYTRKGTGAPGANLNTTTKLSTSSKQLGAGGSITSGAKIRPNSQSMAMAMAKSLELNSNSKQYDMPLDDYDDRETP